MKQLWNVSTAAVLLLLLSSCGFNLGINSERIDFGISPVPLGFSASIYESNPDGTVALSIPSHTLSFSSWSGALGATVEGYTIEFYDASGNPLFSGDNVVNSQGALNVYVPPGLACNEPVPPSGTERVGNFWCRFDSDGVRYTKGPEVTSPGGKFLPITIAAEDYYLLFRGGAVGAYADFYIYGTNDIGRAFRSGPKRVSIQVPQGQE